MLEVTIIVGNPKPKSRTGRTAEMFAAKLLGTKPADIATIDLVNHADELFKWPSDLMAELNGRVARSNLAIFASPTYKASYTGLLKAFLDRYPAGALKGVTAIALMTGADFGHSMAPSVNLVPLLLELGATVPMRGLYFNTGQFDHVESVIDGYVTEFRNALNRLALIELGVPQMEQTQFEGAR